MEDRWLNDITEIGYKYQMTDVAAVMGIEAMKLLDRTLMHHRELFEAYKEGLKGISGITFIGDDKEHQSSCWLATVLVENRNGLKNKLTENGIESNQVHYRNDIYTIFGGRIQTCPNMDAVENKYLVLPKHFHLTVEDVNRVCKVIRSGW
jgi:perosamine synthetase